MRMEIDKENIPVDSHPQVHGVKGRETLNRLLLQTRTGSSAFSRSTFLLCTFLTFLTGACSRCKLSSRAAQIAHAMYCGSLCFSTGLGVAPTQSQRLKHHACDVILLQGARCSFTQCSFSQRHCGKQPRDSQGGGSECGGGDGRQGLPECSLKGALPPL